MEMIKMRNYSKTLCGKEVLKQICLTVEEGETLWLSGPNGAGKTMLLRAVAGLIRPDGGTVQVAGKTLTAGQPFPESVGLVLGNTGFWGRMTGRETLRCLASIRNEAGEDQICQALLRVGLSPSDRRRVGRYSLGMKKRLEIAQAIMEEPRLLLLDEPFNGLDQEGARLLREILVRERQRGVTIVAAAHGDGDMTGLYDRMLVMEEGRVKEYGKGKEQGKERSKEQGKEQEQT